MPAVLRLIKSSVEFQQVASAICRKLKLVYLPGAQDKHCIILDFVADKVDFVYTLAFFQGQNKVKVVLVEIVHQVPALKYVAQIPDTEPAGLVLLLRRSGDLSDWDNLHRSFFDSYYARVAGI